MTNSRAGSGVVLLAKHTAITTETLFTHTFSPLYTSDRYYKVEIIMNGTVTAALAILGEIDDIGSTSNQSAGYRTDGSTMTDFAVAGAATIQLTSTSITSAAARPFYMKWEIFLNPTSNRCGGLIQSQDILGITLEHSKAFTNGITSNTITKIDIVPSTSSWASGTIITVLGYPR